jgi:chromosome segregation ATPase
METQELTQIVTAHQQAIVRQEEALTAATTQHDREIQDIRAILAATAQQQAANAQQIAQNQQAIAQLSAESQLSRQDINSLTASILELRNLVADDMRSRNP